MTTSTREIHLVRRPVGLPQHDDFAIISVELPDLLEGELLVRNVCVSLDPYMRPRMNDVPSYVPPYALDQALTGGAIGEVVESRDGSIATGSLVSHQLGWREHAVVTADSVRIIKASSVPPSYHLGLLGGPGLTAYAGLTRVASLREGESVFVSTAAGAVGSLVGQFARQLGASTVVGSAGTDDKVKHVVEDLGFDAAFNYRNGHLDTQLRSVAPNGVDVYFDNVGGDHLAAALVNMKQDGRVAVCGAIAGYNVEERAPFTGDLFQIISRRLTLRGFISSDFVGLRSEFEAAVLGWLDAGRLVYRESISSRLDNAVDAFLGMLQGENTGKTVVNL